MRFSKIMKNGPFLMVNIFQYYLIIMKILIAVLVFSIFAVTFQQEDVVLEQQQFAATEQLFVAPPIQAQTSELPSNQQMPRQRQPFKFDLATLKLFKYQIFGISLIFFYLILYVRGKATNLLIMENFYRKVDKFLQNNFAHIGFSKQSGEVPFNGESPSESLYYATGRVNVDGIEMRFNTKKRHDLIYILYDILFPQKDTVTIDIPVTTDIPLVFAIAGKKKMKELSENSLDIKKIAGKFKIHNLNDSYQVLGEAADTLDSVIDSFVTKRLNEAQGLFISVHYTDLKMYSNSQGHLRVVLNAAHKNADQFLLGMEVIFRLADNIAGLKLTANSKAKALKSRQAYSQLKEKQQLEKHNQQLRKKKEQKLRQEDAWLKSLPPDRQKREQEKKKKKEINKMMKGKTLKM